MTARLSPNQPRATVEVEIQDAADLLSWDGRTFFAPRMASCLYVWNGSAWLLYWVRVEGRFRRADGSVGKRRMGNSWGPMHFLSDDPATDPPQIVRDLTDVATARLA